MRRFYAIVTLISFVLGVIYMDLPWESILKSFGVRCESFGCIGLAVYIIPIWIVLTPLVIGLAGAFFAHERRLSYGLQAFGISLCILWSLMYYEFYYSNQISAEEYEEVMRQAEQEEQDLLREGEKSRKYIEAEKWFETPEYRFRYDKERWGLYIDDGDQKVFVRDRPLRFAHGKDDLSMLGSYISIRSGEGELPVEGIDTEIVLNGKTVFVREEILERGEKRKTYVFPSPNDPFELWWFSQYPYIEKSLDSQDFENMMRTVELR